MAVPSVLSVRPQGVSVPLRVQLSVLSVFPAPPREMRQWQGSRGDILFIP